MSSLQGHCNPSWLILYRLAAVEASSRSTAPQQQACAEQPTGCAGTACQQQALCQAAQVLMLPAEAGEVMHSRKEPCWVASLCACKHCCSEQPTGCAGTACQHQALCLQRCSCSLQRLGNHAQQEGAMQVGQPQLCACRYCLSAAGTVLGSRGAPAACLEWNQGLCAAGMWCCPMSDQLRTAL